MVWSRQDEPAAMTSRKGVGGSGGSKGQRASCVHLDVRPFVTPYERCGANGWLLGVAGARI